MTNLETTTRDEELALLFAVRDIRIAIDAGIDPLAVARRHAEWNGIDPVHALDLALKERGGCLRARIDQEAVP